MKLFYRFAGIICVSWLCTAVFAEEFSGTITKDYATKEKYNRISDGRTLTVSNNATLYLNHDLEMWGTIIVEDGASFKSSRDGQGFIELHENASVRGADFYYKIYNPDGTEGIRKIPLSFEEIWQGSNSAAKDYIKNNRFAWSDACNGWLQIAKIRDQGNPFNEEALEYWEQVWETSKKADRLANTNKSLVLKKNVTVVFTKNCPDFIRVTGFITLEDGASLTSEGTAINLLPGCEVSGLPLYCRTIERKLYRIVDLKSLWEIDAFNTEDFSMITYDKNLQAWVFDSLVYTNNMKDDKKEAFFSAVEIVE